jgi:hypothetical protein
MTSDLRVVFPNRPGAFLVACEALARAGINVQGFGGDIRPGERWGYVHFLLEDADRALEVLDTEGLEVLDIHAVEVVKAENRPGALAEIIRTYTERRENIEVLYMAGENQVVIGTEAMRRPIHGVSAQDARYQQRRST